MAAPIIPGVTTSSTNRLALEFILSKLLLIINSSEDFFKLIAKALKGIIQFFAVEDAFQCLFQFLGILTKSIDQSSQI